MEVNNEMKSKISVGANRARMQVNCFYSGGSDSFYSTYKFQNDYLEERGRVSETFTPDFSSSDEKPSPSYHSWAMKDESYQLMDCAQSTPKSRDLKDSIDCRSEADLYGLVSTILEEVDPMDSYFSEEISTSLPTGWSLKSQRENSLQDFNSEVKVQSSFGIQHNPEDGFKLYTRPVEIDSDQSCDVLPHFSGSEAAGPSWLYSPCNGESEYKSYTPAFPNLPRPPPGLDISHVARSHFSKSRPGKSENNMSVKESSFHGISDDISESMDAFNDYHSLTTKRNDEMSPFQNFSDFNGRRTEKNNSQQFSMQDVSKLANSWEALLMGEQHGMYNRGSAQRNAMKVQDENMIDLKGLPLQWMSAFDAHTAGSKREITVEQRDGEVGNISPKEFADFGQQSADYFKAPKPFSSSFNFSSNQCKEAKQKKTINLPNSLHQYHHGQSNMHHCNTKPPPKTSTSTDPRGMSKSQSVTDFVPTLSHQQMQRTVSRAFSDFVQSDGRMGCMDIRLGQKGIGGPVDRGEFDLQSDTGRLQTPSATGFMADAHPSPRLGAKPKSLAGFPKGTNKKKALLQNPYQILGNMYAGQVRHNGAKPAPSQTFPCLYQMGVSGQNLGHNFPSQPPLTYRGSVPVPNVSELWPDAEFPPLNPYLQEMLRPNLAGVDGPFPGLISNLRSSNQSTSQLNDYVEECYEQWRVLNSNRKKAKALLRKCFPGEYVSVMNTNSVPKLPPNPTNVDRLIVDQFQEQAKVVSLLGTIERLQSFPLRANSILDRHLEAICITQACRKDQLLNSRRQRQGVAKLKDDKDILLLASALKDLSKSTKLSCTALSCALKTI